MEDFIKQKINIKDLTNPTTIPTSFINNNIKQIEQASEFLLGNQKLLLINGFLGSGKKLIVDFINSQLNPDVLTIKYNCFETTILDDILLSFYISFRNYVIKGKIANPRQKAENFAQKINLYFNMVKKPILITINAYDAILKDNKPDILNFINHISKYANVKIIITSRVFDYEEFKDFDYAQSSILALSQENFEKFLKENDIKNIGIISNELYKQTRGYYHFVNLSIKLMQLKQLSLVKFLENFSKSLMSFYDFIIREGLNLVDPVSLHLFRLLAVMRIPIHLNLLKSLRMYDENSIRFFIQNSILSIDNDSIYLKDYYREIIERQIQDSVMIKIHKSCVDLYETQLPLKPLERDLRLSRQTMRNEIEYHSLFIPKKIEIPTTQPLMVTQIAQVAPIKQKIDKSNEQQQIVSNEQIVEETKEEKFEKINFIFEDEQILDNIANSINSYITEKIERKELIKTSLDINLTEILNRAKQQEKMFNYENAILLYQSALNKTDDTNYDNFLPIIYINLAKVNKYLSKWYEAIEYYTKAQDYYENVANNEKVAQIKLDLANVYFTIYKHDNAKYILTELDKQKNLPEELQIKVNILLGKLSKNLNEEFSYYKKSLDLVNVETEKSLCAELYYRYAGACDEKNEIKTAVEYYKKCAQIKTNNNYLSRALASLAEICDDASKPELAIKYYTQSMEIDKTNKNYNGLYNSAHNIAEIYSSKDEEKSLQYLEIARKYAKELNDPYYIADISIELGNFYLLRKKYDKSLEEFNKAYEIAQNSFSKDNIDKILSKIEYVKKLIG